MGLILLVILVLLLMGGLPTWGYSRNWGYGPSGLLSLLVVVLVVMLLLGYVPMGWGPSVVVRNYEPAHVRLESLTYQDGISRFFQ